ncbi:SanA/YdcF family protein [Taibaiella soli]|uniref:Vancomycin high temperature exclusion protein n=1 Tax=Taibaiella soli TaxID=1649169 RepID=A0A2W2B0H5_9BACT|nr:ElyC/SanA/YdcF family protein [Taibaiella soli]PZF73478.1 vancomycin high temperature exclusion protein [Taibaiella soli]
MRKFFWPKVILCLLLGLFIAVFGIDYWVTKSTAKQMYADINAIPERKAGLLLGTSKYLDNGDVNLYYKYRIDAAVALFKAGKIKYIIVSGDNRKESYNEPEMMMQDLIAAGIPATHIFLDFAGFRTLDSIVRCKAVFGEDNVTIISQPFHNERALFIANHKEVNAIAFNAADVSTLYGARVTIREKMARVKVLVDFMTNKQPRFYGDKISLDDTLQSAACFHPAANPEK